MIDRTPLARMRAHRDDLRRQIDNLERPHPARDVVPGSTLARLHELLADQEARLAYAEGRA